MEKEFYETPSMMIIQINGNDVITTSLQEKDTGTGDSGSIEDDDSWGPVISGK